MQAPRRRGKYLWIPSTTSSEAVLAHLGMSGQLLVGGPDREREKHLRVRAVFTDGGHDLRFVDQRTFGHLMLTDLVPDAFDAGALVPEPIVHIAADPLEDAFDAEAFFRALRRRKTGIKRALLDQSLISGSATSTPTRRCGGPGCTGRAPPTR